VLAAAPGTVVKAGWASEGWTTYGQRVLVRLDTVADGHTYHVMYAHLNAIYVAEGDHVDQGTHIGDMGCSCDGSTTCMWSDICGFGTHLHFAIHQDSIIGGSGTGGSYGGRAVVPEPLDGYEDILHNDILVSTNEPPPAADADADADAPAEDVPGSDADSDVPAGPDADADAGTDGDSDAGPDGDAANEVLPPPDADGMGDVATSDGSDVLVPPGRDDGGCGCAAAGTPAGSFVSLLAPVLAWLVFRVRRRPEGRGISHRRMTQVRTRG
jgi:hypothetical protein